MNAAAFYGLLAWAFLAGTAAALPCRKWRRPAAAGGAALALVPFFGGESLAMALHGALAAPSFTLVQLAALRLARPEGAGPLNRPAAAILAGAALAFYPLALGLGPFDPYGAGYQPQLLLPALLALGGWLAWRRQQVWLAILGFDLLAYAGGLFGNLWDAFLDPVLAAAAATVLVFSRPRPGRSGA